MNNKFLLFVQQENIFQITTSLWINGLMRDVIFFDIQNVLSQEEESDDDAVTAQPQSGASQNVSNTQQPIFAMPAPGSAAPTSTANESTNLNSGGERVIYTTGITSS